MNDAYRTALSAAARDIHGRCNVDLRMLWDDGDSHETRDAHRLKVWNGLGAVELEVEHSALVERGDTYRRFLDDVTSRVRERLTLRV